MAVVINGTPLIDVGLQVSAGHVSMRAFAPAFKPAPGRPAKGIMIRMKYWITRLSHPLRGLKYAFTNDDATQIEFVLGVIGLPIVYLLFNISVNELLLLIFCWFFVMVTELQNTAMEIALTKIHPEHDKEIGLSKDLASGAVIWAAVFGLVCLGFVILN